MQFSSWRRGSFWLVGCLLSFSATAELTPTGDNTFYYRMGGGRSIANPAYEGAVSVPLQVEGDVGLGFNCGLFNPKLSMVNSLNAIGQSFQNMENSILSHATAAIAEFPMYVLSRADPSLYNLLNNSLLGARRDFELSMKSCQAMQADIARGENPYAQWATLSMGKDWQYHMSLAEGNNHQPLAGNAAETASSDINLVNHKVQQDNGAHGVPWVRGASLGRRSLYAGGEGQPPIAILHDTALAGYNLILQAGRSASDESTPMRTAANAHLVDTWANPSVAASWVTNVVGEEKMTTYAGGDKQATPGVGLLSEVQQIAAQRHQQLQALVVGKEAMTLAALQAVSAPGVMINTTVIMAIRQQSPVSQTIIIDKLAEEVAAAQVIDKALLARQLLQEGSQVPAIESNTAAQRMIQRAVARLNQEIEDLLFHGRVRKALVSDTVTQLLQQNQQQQVNRAAIQPTPPPPDILHQGAISPLGEDLR